MASLISAIPFSRFCSEGACFRSKNACLKNSSKVIRSSGDRCSNLHSRSSHSGEIFGVFGSSILRSVRILSSSSCNVFELYGALPNKHSYNMTPMLHKSADGP
ncbi:hypothetical protein RP20_CCG006184 [Aedes albopictus]|nr:hypothetical protein RP20_CCG006184 [Aedes albopictus]